MIRRLTRLGIYASLFVLLVLSSMLPHFVPAYVSVAVKEGPALACLALLVVYTLATGRVQDFIRPMDIPLLLFDAYLVVPAAATVFTGGSISEALFGLRSVALYSFMYFAARLAFRTESELDQFRRYLVALAVAASVLIFIQWIAPLQVLPRMGYSYADPEWRTASGRLRAPGFMTSPTTALVLGGTALWFLMDGVARRRTRIRFLVALAAMLAALALTYSRSGWVAAAMGLAVCLLLPLLSRGRPMSPFPFLRRLLVPGLVGLLALGLLASVTSGALTQMLLSIAGKGSAADAVASTLSRIAIYADDFGLFAEAPVFGAGVHVASDTLITGATLAAYQSHSYWLKLLSQTGLIGLLLFLAVGASLLGRAIPGMRQAPRGLGAQILGLAAFVTVILAGNITIDVLELPPLNVLFWVLCGLLSRAPCLVPGPVPAGQEPGAV